MTIRRYLLVPGLFCIAALNGCEEPAGYAPSYNPCDDGKAARQQCSADAEKTGTYPAVDTIMANRHTAWWASSPAPGCAVGLTYAGEVKYLRAYGRSDLQAVNDVSDNKDWTLATMAPVGSVSKTITALTLLRLLRERSALINTPLDQIADSYTLSDLVPDVPAALATTTIKQFLTHQTGLQKNPIYAAKYGNEAELREYLADLWEDQYADDMSWVELEYHPTLQPRSTYWGHKDADAANMGIVIPGAGRYSNSAYRMLGAAIDFQTLGQDSVLDPDEVGGSPSAPEAYFNRALSAVAYPGGYERSVRATHTSGSANPMTSMCLRAPWRDSQVLDMARGYAAGPSNDGYDDVPQTDLWSLRHASGGWMMTIGDLTRLMVQMESGEILDADDMASVTTTYAVEGSRNYGLGVWVRNLQLSDGNTYLGYEHVGQVHGFSAIYRVVQGPNGPVGAAVMCNVKHSTSTLRATADLLVQQIEADLAPGPGGVAPPSPINVDESQGGCSENASALEELYAKHYDTLFSTWSGYVRRAGGDEVLAARQVRADLSRYPLGPTILAAFDAGDLESAAAGMLRLLQR